MRRTLIGMIGVALLIGAISLFMGFYALWTGSTDCRVLTTSHIDVQALALRADTAGRLERCVDGLERCVGNLERSVGVLERKFSTWRKAEGDAP